MSDSFNIQGLDHVAIRVKDFNTSIAWYEKVLGLKKYQLEKWDPYPVFLMAGKCGVAIFPAESSKEALDPNSKHTKIDHFAFNVDGENYNKAKEKFDKMEIPYIEKDHHYFHSIYLNDPDGHIVELTTLVIAPESFYQ